MFWMKNSFSKAPFWEIDLMMLLNQLYWELCTRLLTFNSRVKKEFTHHGPSVNTFLAVFARNFVNLTRKNRNANLDSPA